MKAYSLDFRQKIIETYENEEISQRALAKRFRVALSFIVKLLKQYRESDSLEARKSPGRPRKLKEEDLQTLKAIVEEQNDLTEQEYQRELQERTGIQVSRATIGRALRRMRLSKKNTLPK